MFSATQGQLLFIHVFDLLFRYGDAAAVRAVDTADDVEKSGFTALMARDADFRFFYGQIDAAKDFYTGISRPKFFT